MDVHQRFDVPAAPRTVWGIISDPRAMVSCVPGASLGEQQDDGSFDSSVAVRFGPVKVTLLAQVSLELDDAAMVGHVTARGKDTQGGTRFTSTMTFAVTDDDGSRSTVAIDGQVELSGKLAGVIESGAPVVVNRMSREFAESLAQRCADVTAGATAQQSQETEGGTA